MSEIIFIAPLPSMLRRTRLTKMVPVVLGAGHSIRFLGWRRTSDQMVEDVCGLTEKAILAGGGYGGLRTRLMYLLWMPLVFIHVLMSGHRRQIFCLGWETAFPALLAAFFTKSQIIFDDADRFSLIMKLPAPIRKIVQKLEYWASRQAKLHLIPGFSRYEWRHDQMIVLANSPLQKDFDVARDQASTKNPEIFTVYVNGWMGRTRGIPILLQALEILDTSDSKIRIVAAGRIDCEDGKKLIGHPSVTYLGEVSQVDALSYYASSDVVLTYYDPEIEINRKAESNKWGDCITFGIPFIVNSEVETARHFVTKGAAWSLEYAQPDALAKLLIELSENSDTVDSAGQALQDFEKYYQPFDLQLKCILQRIQA